MSGITVVDRRDLERVLKAVVHASQRDDVKVEIKYYVQFSVDEDYSVQTLVDPWQPFSRSMARDLVKKAIDTLDLEEANRAKIQKALETVSPEQGGVHEQHAEDLKPAATKASTDPINPVPNPHIEVDGIVL